MNTEFKRLKPAAFSRRILALTAELKALAQAKAPPRDYKVNTWFNPPLKRTFSDEATNHPSRTHRHEARGGSVFFHGHLVVLS